MGNKRMHLANWKLTRRYGNLLGEVPSGLYRISVQRKNWEVTRGIYLWVLSKAFCPLLSTTSFFHLKSLTIRLGNGGALLTCHVSLGWQFIIFRTSRLHSITFQGRRLLLSKIFQIRRLWIIKKKFSCFILMFPWMFTCSNFICMMF